MNLILERLSLQGEGFLQAEEKKVNLSATGLSVTTGEKAEVGDNIEIKMLLPEYPPLGILAHGKVVRVEDKGNGEYELGLHFIDMDEDIRDEIIQYTLKRQREIIRTQRQQGK
jgi:c-di-GMP-binding flagellar brake protein YcgR